MARRPETELRALARARLQSGQLPRTDQDRTWAGFGAGLRCSLCDDPIEAAQVEYELEFLREGSAEPRPFRFHARCLAVWELERRGDP